jgi:hypothetical protein
MIVQQVSNQVMKRRRKKICGKMEKGEQKSLSVVLMLCDRHSAQDEDFYQKNKKVIFILS